MFVFFGTSDNSISVLDKLIKEGYKCNAVITIPDKPVGRKQILTPSPIKLFAQKNNIPVLSVSDLSNLNSPVHQSAIGNMKSLINSCGWQKRRESRRVPAANFLSEDIGRDELLTGPATRQTAEPQSTFAVVADFGLLIPAELIKIFPKGILNLHPSLLPAYQGATPAPFQILRGEKQGGISIITINEKFDEGNIIAQEKFPILDLETTETLLFKGFTVGAKLLIKILPDYLDKKLKPIPQDLSKKSYFPRLSRNDGFIPWNTLRKAIEGKAITESEIPKFMEIAQIPKLYIVNYLPLRSPERSRRAKGGKLYISPFIERAIRALTPWPGVWTEVKIKGQLKRLKLLKSHIEKNKLVLDLVQLEGKNPVSFSQFQQAYRDDII